MNKKIITIDKIIAGGDGMGFLEGKAQFVPQTLPGEVVEVKVLEEKKGFNRCEILSIIEPSPERVSPFCKYYNECGGCNFQYTNYTNQISIKKDMVKDIFLRNGKIELGDFLFFESKSIEYRNRVQFHSSNKSVGFKKKQSNDIIDIDFCPLLVDGLNNYLKNKPRIPSSRITIFSFNSNNYIGNIDKSCTIKIKDKDISFDPNGFFQSNLSMVPTLIDHLNSFLIGSTVMDLYCGIGLFSAFLPNNIKKIIAVEMDEKVKGFIDSNLSGKDYLFYSMSLEDYLNKNLNKNIVVDTIIVDPPRKGLSNSVREYLIKFGVKRIIYVSCDPTTMARDISELIMGGYVLSHFSCFDFYPNTNHIESFGVLDLV